MSEQISLPWTALTRTAMEAVAPILTPALLAHSQRTYALAAAYATRRRIDFDAEGLFTASLFHDLGLADERRDPTAAFTRVGAAALIDHCDAHGVTRARAERLAEAIEFHFQLRPRWQLGTEAGLLQVGAWMDATGLRAWTVPRAYRRGLRSQLPRSGFQRDFQPRLMRSCTSWEAVVGLVRPRPRPLVGDRETQS